MSLVSVRLLIITKTISETSITSFVENPLARRTKIPAGSTVASGLQAVIGYERNSNVEYPVFEFRGLVLHHLTDPADELTYMTTMHADQLVLMDPDFYRVAGVNDVLEDGPSLSPVERPDGGNVIEYGVSVALELII